MAPLPPSGAKHFVGFASGQDGASSLVLVNPSTEDAATGSVEFFDGGGASWAVSVNGLEPQASVSFELPPMASTVFTASSEGGSAMGSARVTTSEGIVDGVLRLAFANGRVATPVPPRRWRASSRRRRAPWHRQRTRRSRFTRSSLP